MCGCLNQLFQFVWQELNAKLIAQETGLGRDHPITTLHCHCERKHTDNKNLPKDICFVEVDGQTCAYGCTHIVNTAFHITNGVSNAMREIEVFRQLLNFFEVVL